MKHDITSRADITYLMEQFYDRLLKDSTISYLFTEVAKINITEHIPVIVDFWESALFQSDTYRKNAMQPHMDLHKKSPLKKSILIPGSFISGILSMICLRAKRLF